MAMIKEVEELTHLRRAELDAIMEPLTKEEWDRICIQSTLISHRESNKELNNPPYKCDVCEDGYAYSIRNGYCNGCAMELFHDDIREAILDIQYANQEKSRREGIAINSQVDRQKAKRGMTNS